MGLHQGRDPSRLGKGDAPLNSEYALNSPPSPAAVKASPVCLSRKMTLEQGFQAIMHSCLAQMQANESGVIAGEPEHLHQMRVGLRRLRSALKMMKDLLSLPADIQKELDWLSSKLSAARDWHVFSDSTLPSIINGKTDIDDDTMHKLEALKDAAGGMAQDKENQASQALQSDRYTTLKLMLSKWLHGAEWREHASSKQLEKLDSRLLKFARTILAKDQTRLLKRGRRLSKVPPAARHRARIAAKRTRYATEFFQSLFPGKLVHRYVDALSDLQDELGVLNDSQVAERLLDDLEKSDIALIPCAEYAKGYFHSHVHGDHIHLKHLWKRFKPLQPPG